MFTPSVGSEGTDGGDAFKMVPLLTKTSSPDGAGMESRDNDCRPARKTGHQVCSVCVCVYMFVFVGWGGREGGTIGLRGAGFILFQRKLKKTHMTMETLNTQSKRHERVKMRLNDEVRAKRGFEVRTGCVCGSMCPQRPDENTLSFTSLQLADLSLISNTLSSEPRLQSVFHNVYARNFTIIRTFWTIFKGSIRGQPSALVNYDTRLGILQYIWIKFWDRQQGLRKVIAARKAQHQAKIILAYTSCWCGFNLARNKSQNIALPTSI